MHPLLVEYFARFQKQPSKKFDYFFSQLSLQEYGDKLPYLYGIERFCLRLLKAKLEDEKICIFSDYDTDAVTATAVMFWGLVGLGFAKENISFYSPDRFVEGYGMNVEAVAKICTENQLIISVDCGINSVGEADYVLKQPGCDLIVTDHHHLHADLPKALAVINPRLAEYFAQNPKINPETEPNFNFNFPEQTKGILEFYEAWSSRIFVPPTSKKPPERFLSESVTGVGVAWFCVVWLSYFFREICLQIPEIKIENESTSQLNSLLGFVAIGTVADCQSILEPTNRLLVRTGIKIISDGNYRFYGLKELMLQTGLQDKLSQGYILTSQDLGFTLAPILNASGRISHANLSIRTLLADQKDQASLLTNELIATNEERKNLVKNLSNSLQELAESQISSGQKTIWLEGDWNKGIIGLLASRYVSIYCLPCVVISTHDGQATASLRAPEGFHLPKALQAASDYLLKFGGHPGAAGFSAEPQNLGNVKEYLLKALELQAKDFVKPVENYTNGFTEYPENLQDLTNQANLIWLREQDLTQELFTQTWLMDPFGQDLPLPRFIFTLESFSVRWLGSENKHIKLSFGKNQTVTAFNISTEIREKLLKNSNHRLCISAKISQNTWNGNTRNELVAENVWIN